MNLIVTDPYCPIGQDKTEIGKRPVGRPRHDQVDLAADMVANGLLDPETGRRITAQAASIVWCCGYRSVMRRLAQRGIRLRQVKLGG